MKEKSDIMRDLLDTMFPSKEHGDKNLKKELTDNHSEQEFSEDRNQQLNDHIFNSNQSFQVVRKRIVKKKH
jgi:predicted DNA binding CopG/RHH family protein